MTKQTKYVIPEDGRTWVYKTFDAAWRMQKSRMKKAYYRKYHNDEERMENRPDRIPLEDFKMLLKYWGDEAVQKIAEDNATHHQELTETHTLGPKPISLVREKLKKKTRILANHLMLWSMWKFVSENQGGHTSQIMI